jgi:hypothetical protein
MIACLVVAALAMVWGSLLPPIVQFAIKWPLGLRIVLAIALMLPAGLLMGLPLPAGMRLLAASQPQLVPWAWGMNGALSVVGATLAIFIAMNWGFQVTLLVASATYLMGLGCLLAAERHP